MNLNDFFAFKEEAFVCVAIYVYHNSILVHENEWLNYNSLRLWKYYINKIVKKKLVHMQYAATRISCRCYP